MRAQVAFHSLPDGTLFRVRGCLGISMKLWQPIRTDDPDDQEFEDGEYYWAVRSDGKPNPKFSDTRESGNILVTPVEWPWLRS